MIDFILGVAIGALIAWLSFFIVVYPYYKSLASQNTRLLTESALMRDAVVRWKRKAVRL